MGSLLRSKKLAEKYIAYRTSGAMDHTCVLCDAEAIVSFSYWKVIPNNFPYDLIAEIHHMLIPIRHTVESLLTENERTEFIQIKADYVQRYDYILEATNKTKSIPEHFHVHLIIGKQIV